MKLDMNDHLGREYPTVDEGLSENQNLTHIENGSDTVHLYMSLWVALFVIIADWDVLCMSSSGLCAFMCFGVAKHLLQWDLDFFCFSPCSCDLCFISALHDLFLFLFFLLPLHVTDAYTQWAAISDASPFSPPLFPSVALFQLHLLFICLVIFVTGYLWRRARWQRLLQEGRGFGFVHFVKEGKIGYIFPWRRQWDNGRKLVSPEYFIWKVGCSDLAGSGSRLYCGAHDNQELKVSQLRVCPVTTWRKEDTSLSILSLLVITYSLSMQRSRGSEGQLLHYIRQRHNLARQLDLQGFKSKFTIIHPSCQAPRKSTFSQC